MKTLKMMKPGWITAAATGLALLLVATVGSAGCETGAQTGGLMGAGIGALAGQAIGGSTGATLLGAAVGGGIGYVIGNEDDKKKASELSATTATTYRHNEVGALGGSRWKLESVTPTSRAPVCTSYITDFRRDGHVVTTKTLADGRVETDEEVYRVVGQTLVINKPGYLVNARFSISGNQLIVDAEDFSAVLTRLW